MKDVKLNDPHFRVEVVACTDSPNRAIWYGQHQCLDEGFALDSVPPSTEEKCGNAIAKHLLPFGHWSPTEHATITFNIGGFSHRVMQQFTRSRIGVSPSVQSFRYTGDRIAKLGKEIQEALLETDASTLYELLEFKSPSLAQDVDALFYQRPVGDYRDREGKSYHQTIESFCNRRCWFARAAMTYSELIDDGCSYEDAVGVIPMDARQNWVATFNVRSFCGYMDRRTPANAQLEIRKLSFMLWEPFKEWVPEIAEWYEINRLGKNKLAP